jgi:chromosome segregation protein
MRLKKLELHGYKTFASKIEFLFDDGVTAIVGPNGSGKSNVADGMRWVLGEQRISAMRARKSEDMIFNGTDKRARMGLAQAFITIDNSDEQLPLDFSEIVIGRRIYRNGENEYLINGQKVRLRDVQELLGHAGIGTSTYTVIGQGLIDSALALRAEERRQLIEDAAGLGAYQGKREEALRRLEQTQDNLTRARDIVAELEPQLKRLKRQAERAEEYNGLNQQLHEFLRQWYGYRWEQAAQTIKAAREQVALTANELQASEEEVRAVEQRLDALRRRHQAISQELDASRRERNRLRAEAERLRRERAVADERTRLLARQAADMQQELDALAAEEATLAERIQALASEGAALQQARQTAQAALTEAEAALAGAAKERELLRTVQEQARRDLAHLVARQGELTQRQRQASERQAALIQEREGHHLALTDLEQQLARREGEMALIEADLAELARQNAESQAQRRAIQAARTEAQEAQRQAQESLRQTERTLDALRTRHDLLARLRREGAGYEAGVRALLAAPALPGLLGPVASLLRVPDDLAPAITVALAERLQAVVVTDQAAADAARTWLQHHNAGRVTLLSLDTLAPPAEGRSTVDYLSEGEGSKSGRTNGQPAPSNHTTFNLQPANLQLADLPITNYQLPITAVHTDHPPLLTSLLRDWVLVETWQDAQHAITAGWNVVTRDGQVWRRDGSITAGKGQGNGTELLAQSREWGALPGQIATATEARDAAQAALDQATDRLHDQEEHLAAHEREQAELSRRRQRADQALQRERRDAEKLQQERGWRQGLIAKATKELDELLSRAATLDAEMATLTGQRQAAEEAVQRAEAAFEAADPGTRRAAVERARTQVAVTAEQHTNWQRSQREQNDAAQRLAQRRAGRERQAHALAAEQATLAASSATLIAEAERVEAAEAKLMTQLAPREQERRRIEEEQAQQEERFTTSRQRRREREEAAHTATLAFRAAEDRVQHLREQIEADLGMVEMAELSEELPHQSVLPWDELVTTLPKVTVLADGVEEDIRRLRRRLGQIGAINPNAPTEYEEVATRYDFLTTQSADLQQASTDLKQVVAELDTLMRQRFVASFEAINTEFKLNFTRLFGGGKAHMELTDPENIATTGIEVVARPPGKKQQSIALLSGGERALTAAALIFAILRVSPAPFCVLDEVDAMLDEANVGRFRDMLHEMAQKTQFIVITHNRGTIEAANTIYGISQADSGVSEVLSLALETAISYAKQ